MRITLIITSCIASASTSSRTSVLTCSCTRVFASHWCFLCRFGDTGNAGQNNGTEDGQCAFGSLLEELSARLEFFISFFHICVKLKWIIEILLIKGFYFLIRHTITGSVASARTCVTTSSYACALTSSFAPSQTCARTSLMTSMVTSSITSTSTSVVTSHRGLFRSLHNGGCASQNNSTKDGQCSLGRFFEKLTSGLEFLFVFLLFHKIEINAYWPPNVGN